MKKISVVVACYRDQPAIPHMHRRLVETLTRLGVDYELIFVNDGSPDDTERVLAELVAQDEHVVAINHSRNFSSQMAFTSGMEIATGDAVVIMDGDLQDPPELIAEFCRQWELGFDVVYGVRTRRQAPLVMRLAYKMFYRLFRALSYVDVPLDAGDFSLIDRKVVDQLKEFPERDRFLRGLRAWVGFRQCGVPYLRPERMFGRTTNSLFKNLRWATKGIFAFSYVPLELMALLSLATFCIALIGMVVQIVLRFALPDAPHGITTVLVVVLFLGAIQLLGISILGQYVGKIFEEVKQRPRFIVRSIVRRPGSR